MARKPAGAKENPRFTIRINTLGMNRSAEWRKAMGDDCNLKIRRDRVKKALTLGCNLRQFVRAETNTTKYGAYRRGQGPYTYSER
jgi:hypothetical protein